MFALRYACARCFRGGCGGRAGAAFASGRGMLRLWVAVGMLGMLGMLAGCGESNRGNSVGGGAAAGGGGASGVGIDHCGVQNFMLARGNAPDLLIVQDRSGSMSLDANDLPLVGAKNPKSKWMQIASAIAQVAQSVSGVQWGLMMFSADGQCGAPSQPDVPVASGNAAAIKQALDDASPAGLTPTTAAIDRAVAYLKGGVDPDGRARYLLLATDGQPNCSDGSFGTDDAAAIQAVANAAQAGIHTFVVGIGGKTGADQTLAQMAMSGKEPNTTAGQKPYYSVSTTQDLVAVLTAVAGKVASCSYTLEMAPPSPDLVTVEANGKTVPRDPTRTEGWDYGPMQTSIVFYGQSCKDLQQGLVSTVRAIFGCPPLA